MERLQPSGDLVRARATPPVYHVLTGSVGTRTSSEIALVTGERADQLIGLQPLKKPRDYATQI